MQAHTPFSLVSFGGRPLQAGAALTRLSIAACMFATLMSTGCSHQEKMAAAPQPRQESANLKTADFSGSSRRKKELVRAPSAALPSALASGGAREDFDAPFELEAGSDSQNGVSSWNTEAYDRIFEQRFVSPLTAPLSTFSVDVDTASYSNVRRYVENGSLPPPGAVRIEELINYFDYGYQQPEDEQPLAVYSELSTAPWAAEHKLLHIGLQGRRIDAENIPPRNLVFLLDVSGSMDSPGKLPLLKRSLTALLDTMTEKDTISIVVYAGASGLVLPPTPASYRARIERAFHRLSAGGGTNGAEGINLAYQVAERSFQQGGVNRVILATDGDFNVGTSSQSELVRLIEKKRDSGVFLTVLGFGMGNYKDSTLEKLADHGNGNYGYIDSFSEAKKILVEEGGANLITIARDVKIQVEMNPKLVGAYRLIGYENRRLQAEDFNDDEKDAGEVGAGHTVTALYEILDHEQAAQALSIDPLKYQRPEQQPPAGAESGPWRDSDAALRSYEIATIKLRYKRPGEERSRLQQVVVSDEVLAPRATSEAFRFSAAVAGFGMMLRRSKYRGDASWSQIKRLAGRSMGRDRYGHKRQFLSLVGQAARL